MNSVLTHNFINAGSKINTRDVICATCNVRVSLSDDGNWCYLIIGYVDDNIVGTGGVGWYLLTCEEQQIKNLLE